MEPPILSDKNEYPTEAIIFSHIGKSKLLWNSIFEYIHANNTDLSEEWRYYNDGKSWLLKITRKAKTVSWVSVIGGSFRMTFYFNDKAEQAIFNSLISNELKEQFKNGKRYNRIRGLTITFRNNKDVEYAKAILMIKLSIS